MPSEYRHRVVANKTIGVEMYTITGSNIHYRCCIIVIYLIIHARLKIWQHWLMVQFGFLSTYGLFDLYMHLKKGDANGHHKVESVAKITIFE